MSTKYYTDLFDAVIDDDNMFHSYNKASIGRTDYREFRIFHSNYSKNLAELQYDIVHNLYTVGEYEYFTVYEKKKRDIMKLPPRDRIAQHAWYSVCNPLFESKFIYDSYACRINKGGHAANERLHGWLYNEGVLKGRKLYAIKGDLHHYFKSINHAVLKNQIYRTIRDERLFNLTSIFIDSNGNMPDGVGIPVGNLTSQVFANIYGSMLDNFCKHVLKCTYYIRYMDDFIILADNYHELEAILSEIRDFVICEMFMFLNPSTNIVFVNNGLNFLGFKHFIDHYIPLDYRITNIVNYVDNFCKGNIPLSEFCLSYPSMRGYVQHADCFSLLSQLQDKITDHIFSMYSKSYNDVLLSVSDIENIIKRDLGGYYNAVYSKDKYLYMA